jgi:hypothetical protein
MLWQLCRLRQINLWNRAFDLLKLNGKDVRARRRCPASSASAGHTPSILPLAKAAMVAEKPSQPHENRSCEPDATVLDRIYRYELAPWLPRVES